MRRRARHRLIGATVLVLVAVIGFPLVFDTQPRPVAVDVPILIPDRTQTAPLAVASAPVQSPASAAVPPAPLVAAPPAAKPSVPLAASAASRPAVQVAAPASLDAREEIVSKESAPKKVQPSVEQSPTAIKKEAFSAPAVTEKPKPKPEPVAKPAPEPEPKPKPKPKPEPKPEPKPKAEPKPEPRTHAPAPTDDGRRARALLEGKEVAKPAAADGGRFIVQVGAFSDDSKAREMRLKAEKAGVATYVQTVDTKDGKRIRVRVGPFSSRAEADKAAAKLRALNLPSAILSL
jgi:DedD protein